MNDKRLSRYFFIALLLGTAVVFFRMLQIFFVPVLLAAVFATLFTMFYFFRDGRDLRPLPGAAGYLQRGVSRSSGWGDAARGAGSGVAGARAGTSARG